MCYLILVRFIYQISSKRKYVLQFEIFSGLANSVNWTDLEELFNPFGQGMKLDVKMHYSTSGLFMGSAEVILPNRKLALRAAEAYNNVHLDNSTMTVVVEGHDLENEMVPYIPDAAKKCKEPTVEELGVFSCTFDYTIVCLVSDNIQRMSCLPFKI